MFDAGLENCSEVSFWVANFYTFLMRLDFLHIVGGHPVRYGFPIRRVRRLLQDVPGTTVSGLSVYHVGILELASRCIWHRNLLK